MEKARETVVLLPFMARGHIIPFLALAQRLHQMGYIATIINTPLNIKKLHQSLPPVSSSIKLLEIPFNSSDHGLPPNAEDADSLPYSLSLRLLQASLQLKLPFKNLIQQHGADKPVSLISDIFFGWAADVAHELRVHHAIFSVTGAFGLACYCSTWLNLPHRSNTGSVEFHLPDFPEAGKFHITQLTPALLAAGEDDQFTDFLRTNIIEWSKADALLFNTVEDLDKTGFTYFRRKLGIPVRGIGPLLLSPEQNREATISTEDCIRWLDKKESHSVIYVSFGLQHTISASQMMNLAKALDSSGRSFIWVVRPPLGFDTNEEFVAEQWLPEGFLLRVHDEERGLIVQKWAPQLEILAHRSTGLYISHCGWNSVLESLENGVPLISWPMAAEQFYNAKLLAEDVGVCVEVARGTHFEVRPEDIVEKIEIVMGENETGNKIRRKSLEIRETIRDAVRDEEDYQGSSVKAMQEFFTAALLKKVQACVAQIQ